jgi:hypothetical protein
MKERSTMDGMNQFDAWIALSKDRTNRHLYAVKIAQVTREAKEQKPVRRTWLAQHTGRLLRGVGGQLVIVGSHLECGCDVSVYTGHAAGAALGHR